VSLLCSIECQLSLEIVGTIHEVAVSGRDLKLSGNFVDEVWENDDDVSSRVL